MRAKLAAEDPTITFALQQSGEKARETIVFPHRATFHHSYFYISDHDIAKWMYLVAREDRNVVIVIVNISSAKTWGFSSRREWM